MQHDGRREDPHLARERRRARFPRLSYLLTVAEATAWRCRGQMAKVQDRRGTCRWSAEALLSSFTPGIGLWRCVFIGDWQGGYMYRTAFAPSTLTPFSIISGCRAAAPGICRIVVHELVHARAAGDHHGLDVEVVEGVATRWKSTRFAQRDLLALSLWPPAVCG